ncbi:hypothetical protein C8R46DRAFT_1351205 [Mycena filopes]|nr:hypothetical protein C8R46DRAFT_1351205 [Mycena filopes]
MEPPFTLDYLASLENDPIPAFEARVARAWILKAEQETARMDQEIRDIESRRLELHRVLRIYRRALAPHKTLPVEILREIFGFCGGTANLNDIAALQSKDIRPALCGVCSRWRAVALATPELWSDVRVNLGDVRVNLGHRNPAQLLTALNLWLSRAGLHPVTLNIIGSQTLVKDSPERARIDQLIVEYSGRFRSLSLNSLPLGSTLFTTSPGLLEQLETLSLGISNTDRASGDSGTIAPPFSAGVVAPKLRSLTLFPSYGSIGLPRLRFPWSTLTELTVTDMFPPILDYYLVLEECKSLTTTSFVLHGRKGHVHPAPREFSLPCIRELYLDVDFFHHAIRFLDKIVLDSLTSLEMEVESGSNEIVKSIRSFPSLLQLDCHFEYPGTYEIRPSEGYLLLRACPAAVAVAVEFSPAQATLVQIGNGTLLPHAQQLGLSAVDPAVLIRILKTRRESSVCATIVRAAAWPLRNCTADEVNSFSDLLDMGVFVSTSGWLDPNFLENDVLRQKEKGLGYYGINSCTAY